MYTPHPSLVPIEMASAGMLTVTNSFENKTAAAMAAISTNLIAAEPGVEAIADALCEAAAGARDVERRARGSAVRWSRDWDAPSTTRCSTASRVGSLRDAQRSPQISTVPPDGRATSSHRARRLVIARDPKARGLSPRDRPEIPKAICEAPHRNRHRAVRSRDPGARRGQGDLQAGWGRRRHHRAGPQDDARPALGHCSGSGADDARRRAVRLRRVGTQAESLGAHELGVDYPPVLLGHGGERCLARGGCPEVPGRRAVLPGGDAHEGIARNAEHEVGPGRAAGEVRRPQNQARLQPVLPQVERGVIEDPDV